MRIDVGYPDWIMDDDKLDEEYEGVSKLGVLAMRGTSIHH